MKGVSYYIKTILGKTEYLFSGLSVPAGELVVLNYHGTQKRFLPEFQKQLDFLSKHFSFFNPEELPRYFSKKNNFLKPAVLITFDDGIKNNLHAARILSERKIYALFFIVPGFVESSETMLEAYFRKNIRQEIDRSIGTLQEDLTPMNWGDLQEIKKLGHIIGAHSTTQTLDSATSNDEKSFHEIVVCKNLLSAATNSNISSFCAPNNSLLSCGIREMKLIKQHYNFFFSTIPGSNLSENNPFFIHRSNVEVDWNKGAFIQSIGKWDRERWEGKSKLFRKITG